VCVCVCVCVCVSFVCLFVCLFVCVCVCVCVVHHQAYERGAEVIITIDDDNFFIEGQDFIGEHCGPISTREEHEQLTSNTGWLNVCSFLKDKNGVEYYPRGYPMNERFRTDPPFYKSSNTKRKVVVNAGLWLDDPGNSSLPIHRSFPPLP
jgi:hypothetical protein